MGHDCRPDRSPLDLSAVLGHDVNQLTDRIGGAAERGLLVFGQVELDDLLDAVRAEPNRDADVQAVDAILAYSPSR